MDTLRAEDLHNWGAWHLMSDAQRRDCVLVTLRECQPHLVARMERAGLPQHAAAIAALTWDDLAHARPILAAARVAARDAEDAAWDAARVADRDARIAARDVARDAEDAAWAAEDAAWAASEVAAWAVGRAALPAQVEECIRLLGLK